MSGLTFLFSAALFALPIAGVPVILHLLFRRKSPVIPFPTLRFIKSSIQRTAARRRVHRWLLLATRALLLALLIWAIAQPAKILSSGWFGGGSTVAAIVIDTTYSMQYQPQEVPLLSRAGTVVQDLLRDQLKDAQVAIYRSQQPAGNAPPEQLLSATEILANWTDLTPQPAAKPLVDRIAAARELLNKQSTDQKWLIVLTDGQSREFPRPTGDAENLRCVWFDLHPDVPRSAGITKVGVEPRSVMSGLNATVPVRLTGRPGDAYAVALSITTPAGEPVAQLTPTTATLDTAGSATVRFPYRLPVQRWLVLNASIPQGDEMPWDNQRPQLIELPPRQKVALLTGPNPPPSARFIKLALDPSEGRSTGWPVEVTNAIAHDVSCAVVPLGAWPDLATSTKLRDLARGGGTVVLFVQPGLEETWAKVDKSTQAVLKELLPSEPLTVPMPSNSMRAGVTNETLNDPLMDGLTDEKFQLNAIVARRMVPFSSADQSVVTLLRMTQDEKTATTGRGFVFRRSAGTGSVYTIATLPDARHTNLATHPVFLPLLVRMALRSGTAADPNVELGKPLTLPGSYAVDVGELQIETPSKATYVVPQSRDDAGRRFEFTQATEAGLYAWRVPGRSDPVAWTNVQLPAAEAELKYRDAATIAPQSPADGVLGAAPNVVIVRSVEDLNAKIAAISQPQPRWTTPIALVLALLCAEAFLGSITQVTKAINWRGWFGGAPASS
jgi:hypothetical protein